MHMNLPISLRAVITRSITIIPCIMVSVFVNENGLTFIVNFVNSSLAILLPFALTVRRNERDDDCHIVLMITRRDT